jgi:hypothetical protein
MYWRTLTTIAALCSVVVWVTMIPNAVFAQSTLVGTWKLNLEKSKFSPGPAPMSSTLTYEAVGQAMKVTNEGMNAQGNPTKSVFGPFSNDGKPSPVTGVPDFDESTYKQVNDTTVEYSRLKGGKPVQSGTRVLSTDGKTLTFTSTGTNASGQQINNVAVYDKQ